MEANEPIPVPQSVAEPLTCLADYLPRVTDLRETFGEDFDRRVAKYWRIGMARACTAAVIKYLEGAGISHQEIAERTGFDPSRITHFIKTGDISVPGLIALMTVLRLEFGDLQLPSCAERNIAGYMEAISRIRQDELEDETYQRPIDREEFECLVEVYSSEEWLRARKRGKLDATAQDVLTTVQGRLRAAGLPIGSVPNKDALLRVLRDWGTAYLLLIIARSHG